MEKKHNYFKALALLHLILAVNKLFGVKKHGVTVRK